LSEQVLPRPAFVASIAPRDLEDARRLAGGVPEGASAIEYRLDLAEAPIPLARLLELDPRPVLATWRTAAEGGGFSGTAEEYRRLTREAYAAGATVDIEYATGLLSEHGDFEDRRRVVASFHSPFALPEDWETRLAAMAATGARAVKFVAGAAELPTALRLAEIQKLHKGGPVAVFPMGPGSPPGRVLSALFGASLVFGAVERRTAAGQISLAELLDVYGVNRPRPIETLFGIVGAEVSGSLSPALHNALFFARGLPWLYLPLPVADFARVKPQDLLFDPPFRGFSITQPWKRQAVAAGRPSDDVSATGAANTLVRERSAWRSENTDVDGFFDPLADHDTGEGRTAVVLGAGGAARAAVVAARRLGYEVLVSSRHDARADALARELSVDSLGWQDVAASEADLYVNATPLGAHDEDGPAVPAAVLANRPLVFDCVYRRDGSATPTVKAARAAGCAVVPGIQMFAAQAVRQARLFGVESVTPEEVTEILRRFAGAS
jgi:shikimate dehydrogenase